MLHPRGYQRCSQGFFREPHLNQLAGINPKDAPLSQMFDFSPLQQIFKEGG